MDKIESAKNLLNLIGMPPQQCGDLCALTLLAMAGLGKRTPWPHSGNQWIRIHDVMQFIATKYGVTYAENSRETFRKQAMHPFRVAAIIEDNGMPTNSPNYKYRITNHFLEVLKNVIVRKGTIAETESLRQFIADHETLTTIYASKKNVRKMPVRINGNELTFSPGAHNLLQKAVLEEFAPRFAPEAECLYVGDTVKKDLVCKNDKLVALGINMTLHDKMPDVVLYIPSKNWIYFIEAVTSVGPMSAQRVVEIDEMTKNVNAGKIYVTAFPDLKTFKKFSDSLAWETEVWIADLPDHMIHMNGDKFLGPR